MESGFIKSRRSRARGSSSTIPTGKGRSAAALDILEVHAHARNISVRRIQRIDEGSHGARAGIDLLHADLETIELPAHRHVLILCVRYLQRSLFPQICRALRPGGVLLFE